MTTVKSQETHEKKKPTFFKELSNFLGDRPEAKGLDNYIDTGTSPDGEASVSEIQSTESSVGTGKLNWEYYNTLNLSKIS